MANKKERTIDAKISVESTKATSRTDIKDSENLSSIIGKVRKHLDDITDVAFTGSYNDLSDTPEIPDISSKADKANTVTNVSYDTTNKKFNKTINNKTTDIVTVSKLKTDLALTKSDVGLSNVGNFKAVSTVASQGLTDTEKANARTNIGAGTSSFSGNYNDLSNKPTIPTVNNGTLTIQKNGTNVATFTANQSGDSTANITVPTKVSELTNDSGYTTNTGTVTQVKVGSTAYNPSSGVISLPAYPTDTNTHRPIQLNGTEILGNNTTALNLKAGSNVSMSNNNGTVTFSNSGVRSIASGSTNGTISVNTNGTSTNVAVQGLGSAAYTSSTAYAVITTLTNEDLNNVTTPGFYNVGGDNSVTNKPSGVNAFGLEVVHTAAGSYYTQKVYPNSGSVAYRRYCSNGTWSSWTLEKLTDTTYSTVSKSAAGLCPALPNETTTTKYLRQDGTWQVPPDTNTDTKVTSSANHYTPATASGSDKTASATGATAAWSIDVVKGVTLNTDGKGHVTGLSVTSGKIPANPNTWRGIQDNLTSSSNTTESLSAKQGYLLANGSARDSTKLPLTGGTLTGFLTLHREGATADNVASGIKFSNKDTTTGQTYSSAYIWAYNDHNSSGSYGINMVIQTGGGLFLGSGESPANHYSAKGSTYNGEETFLTSDGLLHLQANGNTIANRAGVQITTGHALVPEKADVATNNIGSIGTSDYKWANGYFTNINGVAVGNSPKFTDTNTDTKVTSVGNHYAPAEDSDAQLSASASGATAAWSIDVVKGVTVKRDAKGHVTGIAVTSGKIPANPNTDTKVTVSNTNPTTGTWYYPIWYTATSGTGGANANDGFRYYSLQGTASVAGAAYISLGNATASGTAGNKRGFLRLYAEKSGYADIVYTASATTNATHTFPTTGGTILNTGTTSFTQSLTSGTAVGTLKINGTDTILYAPTNTWRGIQDNLTSSDVTTQSLSAKQGYLLANGSARDNTKLPLSGGTVTGNITMSGSKIILKGTNIDLNGSNPSSLTWSNSEFDFNDKDGNRAGFINVARQTDGSTKLSIMAECRKSDDSGDYYNGIDFIVDRSGNRSYAVSDAAKFRSAIGAGTSSLTIGTTSTTAAAGNHTHSYLINTGKLGVDGANIYFQPASNNTTDFNIYVTPNGASTGTPITFTTNHTGGYSFDKAIKITGGIDATTSLVTDTNVVCGSKSSTSNNGLRCIAQSGEQFNVCMTVASTGAQNLFTGAQYTTTAHSSPVVGPMTIGTTTSTSKITMNCVASGGFCVPTVYSITGGSANVYVDSSGRLQRSTSSRRYKDNIVYINDEENIYHNALMQMKPVLYNFKSEPDITRMGMIAEDINELCPVAAIEEYESVYNITEEEAMADETLIRECIGKRKTGEIENYEDRAIIAMLVMEVQRLNKEIQELKNK